MLRRSVLNHVNRRQILTRNFYENIPNIPNLSKNVYVDEAIQMFNNLKSSTINHTVGQYINTMNDSLKQVDEKLETKEGDKVTISGSINIGVFSMSTTIERSKKD